MDNNNFNLAFQNYKKNNLETAIKICEKILKKNTIHFDSLFLLGSINAEKKNFGAAKKLLQKANKIKPSHWPTLNNLGYVFQELEEHQQAVGNYKKAIQIQKDNPMF